MYNQRIVNAPVTLFLGAGASKPFGKMLMGEFIFYLENQRGFRSRTFFREIVGVPEGRDLEHLFEELDEWSRKGYYEADPDGVAPIRGLGLGRSESPREIVGGLAREATEVLRDLRKEVFAAYREISDGQRQNLVQRYEKLFEVLLESLDLTKYPLTIFTTNYDPAIEIFAQAKPGEYRLCDGFVYQGNAPNPLWRRDSIDNLQLEADSRKCIVLFKLHGSTSWFKRGTEFVKSDISIYTEDDPSFENLLIYPAKKKVALNDPYFTGYDYFQRTLENCKLCIVIGYSFRDYDALSRLRSAASCNSALRLLVLDTQAESLCKRLRGYEVVAAPLAKLFGSEYEKDYLSAISAALPTHPRKAEPA